MTLKEDLAKIDTEIEQLEERRRKIYESSLAAPESEKLCADSVARMLAEPEWFERFRYPISVTGIHLEGRLLHRRGKRSDLVRVRPCGDEFAGKTYLGLYLGDMARDVGVTFNRESGVLSVELSLHNPAIWIPSLKRVVFGSESWWGAIQSEEELREITTESISSLWYVQALKSLHGEPPKE